MGPVPPVLRYWWKFDNNFNDSADTQPMIPQPGAGINFPPLLRLDGQTHYADAYGLTPADWTSAVPIVSSEFSLMFWFKTDEVNFSFDVLWNAGVPCGIAIARTAFMFMTAWINNYGASLPVPLPSYNNFNHYAFTVGAAGNFSLYINGNFVASNPAASLSPWSGGVLNVGLNNPTFANFMAPFSIDSLRIYNGELDAAGVQAVYLSELPAP